MHVVDNISDGVGGEVCGGVGGVLLANSFFEEEEGDCFEIGFGDVGKVDPGEDGEGEDDVGKCSMEVAGGCSQCNMLTMVDPMAKGVTKVNREPIVGTKQDVGRSTEGEDGNMIKVGLVVMADSWGKGD